MNKIGIWIDKHTAVIISLNQDKHKVSIVESDIDDYKDFDHKALKQSDKYTNDRTFMQRTKHQTKDYFNKIVSKLNDADNIVIFGPSMMGGKLKSMLDDSNKSLSQKIKDVHKAPKLSENQIIAWVKDYYNIPKASI